MDTTTPTIQALDLLQITLDAARREVMAGNKDVAAKHFERLENIACAEVLRLSPLRPSGGAVLGMK
jgi:hypothetical protein